MHFGATLQLLRRHAGVVLRALATQVGVSPAYVSRVEHGHDAPPSPARGREIALALGLPPGLLEALLDEARSEPHPALGPGPVGRRLAFEIRRRNLGEAQLARILAFIGAEFPVRGEALAPSQLLDASRVLLRVRATDLSDAWSAAALRLEGVDPSALAATASALGAGVVVGWSAEGPARAALVVLANPLAGTPSPDEAPLRIGWALSGLGPGPEGAQTLAAVARTADPELTTALSRAPSTDALLEQLRAFEARS